MIKMRMPSTMRRKTQRLGRLLSAAADWLVGGYKAWGTGGSTHVDAQSETDVIACGKRVCQLVSVGYAGEIAGVKGQLGHDLVSRIAGNGVDRELVRRLPLAAVSERPGRVIGERGSVAAVAGKIEDEGSNWILLDGGEVCEGAILRDPRCESNEAEDGPREHDLRGILRHVERPLGAEGAARHRSVEQTTNFGAGLYTGGGERPDVATLRKGERDACLRRVSREPLPERDERAYVELGDAAGTDVVGASAQIWVGEGQRHDIYTESR